MVPSQFKSWWQPFLSVSVLLCIALGLGARATPQTVALTEQKSSAMLCLLAIAASGNSNFAQLGGRESD